MLLPPLAYRAWSYFLFNSNHVNLMDCTQVTINDHWISNSLHKFLGTLSKKSSKFGMLPSTDKEINARSNHTASKLTENWDNKICAYSNIAIYYSVTEFIPNLIIKEPLAVNYFSLRMRNPRQRVWIYRDISKWGSSTQGIIHLPELEISTILTPRLYCHELVTSACTCSESHRPNRVWNSP